MTMTIPLDGLGTMTAFRIIKAIEVSARDDITRLRENSDNIDDSEDPIKNEYETSIRVLKEITAECSKANKWNNARIGNYEYDPNH